MQPSPGRIHSLPIKILYSVDNSSQSFLTILHDHHDVYIHPGDSSARTGAGRDEAERYGSCCLKGIAWGICFASPECVPSQHTHDFSVYNLDPILRSARQREVNGSTSSTGSRVGDSWSGKGFLSWALAEPDKGTTLIRGRLVQEAEFSSAGMNGEEGGLEGLMAAASRGSSGAEGGWGLEIVINLKVVPWASAGGIGARKDFEEMLSKGKEGLGIGSTGPPSINGSAPAGNGSQVDQATRATPTPVARPVVQPPRGTSSAPTTAPVVVKTAAPTSANGRATANGHAPPNPIAARNNALSANTAVRPPATARGPPSSNPSSSLPPSSIPPSSVPMSATSSAQGSRASPAPALQRQDSLPPNPNSSGASSSSTARQPASRAAPNRVPAPQANAGPSRQPAAAAPPATRAPPPKTQPPPPQAAGRDREVTPPPRASPKSPPPTTPSRQTLHALLQSDSKMSPGLARQLANHPALLRLLKAVPATSMKSLQSDHASTQTNGSSNGAGLAPGMDVKPSPAMSDNIPTPTNAVVGNGEGCCNCGTLETDLWRTKKTKDGTERKVCNDCGLYFNKHKKMRPPEFWSVSQGPTASGPAEKKAKVEDVHGIRSSPRLHRNGNSSSGQSQTSQANGHANGHVQAIEDSPRKRKRGSVLIPNPSPRRATRAAAKEGLVAPDFGLDLAASSALSHSNGAGAKKEEITFSPSTMFMTSPLQPPTALDFVPDVPPTGGPTEGESEIDIEALLASFVDTHGDHVGVAAEGDVQMNGGGAEGQFDLEALLNGTLDPAMSQEMMSFLSTMNWDGVTADSGDASK